MANEITLAGMLDQYRFDLMTSTTPAIVKKKEKPSVLNDESRTQLLLRFERMRVILGVRGMIAEAEQELPVKTAILMQTPKYADGRRFEAIITNASEGHPDHFVAHQTFTMFSVNSAGQAVNRFAQVAVTVGPTKSDLQVTIGRTTFNRDEFQGLSPIERNLLLFQAWASSLRGQAPGRAGLYRSETPVNNMEPVSA